MPANLTPQYRKAEEQYRQACDAPERLDALNEMFRLLPKHKGSEKLQADLKKKIAEAKREVTRGAKGKKKGVSHHVESGGHPQVVLVGPPNAGKSALASALSGVDLQVAEYPYTTREPHPAMMKWEGARIQLVDTPPIFPQFMEPWLSSIVRAADRAILVVDRHADDLLEGIEGVFEQLEAHKTILRTELHEEDGTHPDFPLGTAIVPTLLVAGKGDLDDENSGLTVLEDLYADRFEILPVSVETGAGLDRLSSRIFSFLDRVRIFPKPPGQPVDREEPILLPQGGTVLDLAGKIHKDLAAKLKSARQWGNADGEVCGRWVARDHVLKDQDVIELEF